MCGIFWSLISENFDIYNEFMKLKHRGPDNTTCITTNNNFIGTHRLAIININSNGNQPLLFNGTYLICNGQIYNYKNFGNYELRTDVDIILRLFCDNIYNSIDELALSLDGDFSFIICDKDAIYIARDPIGIRPLFYGTDEMGNIICASSEAKSLINLPFVKKVNVFPPGNVYDSKTKKIREYTNIYLKKINISENQNNNEQLDNKISDKPENITKTIREKLILSVKKRIINSDRPVALLCSGGIDSSIILSIAMDLMEVDKIHIFSMSYDKKGNGKGKSDDTFYASMLAKEYNVKHTNVTFTLNDIENNIEKIIKQIESYDPNTIRASVPMYMLAKYISENTEYKVILSGEGADELFMGYNIFMNAPSETLANDESERLIKNIHMFDLLRADRCFMAHGLEIRVPFLDIDFVKYVLSIDGKYKMFIQRIEKLLLRTSFSDNVKLQKTRILERSKERFSDGCGFQYVPDLLNFCSNSCSLNLKEEEEKDKYKRIFESVYVNCEDLIIKRTNPSWCNNDKNDKNLMKFV